MRRDRSVPAFYDAITEFIFVQDEPVKSDVIFIPGSNYAEPAMRAAGLYLEGYAPLVLPSGRYSKTVGAFHGPQETEWAFMRDILTGQGVPESAVLREDRAEYTWQNAIFSRQVLEAASLMPERALLCAQAYHARRALTYYQQQFPDTRISVIPVTTRGITAENWYTDREKTAVVLGELRRCGEQFSCMLPVGPDGPESTGGMASDGRERC